MKKDFQFSYELLSDWKDLSIEDQVLVDKAYDALETAYAPYSEFKVGASVRLDNDAIIIGSNQENAAYPSGLCAERVALFHIGSNYPKQSIKTICIVAKGDLLPLNKLLSPCGGYLTHASGMARLPPWPFLLLRAQTRSITRTRSHDRTP